MTLGLAAQDVEGDAQRTIAAFEAAGVRHDVLHGASRVCWRRFGSGPPLVLLHGGYGSWLHWVRNIARLAQRHTLWVPDLPGAGDSGDVPEDLHADDPLARVSQRVQGSLDALLGPGERIAVAGFSFGALVAARMAMDVDRVERLALLGPAGHGGARRMPEELRPWRLSDPVLRRCALHDNLNRLMLHTPAPPESLAFAVHEASCEKNRFRSKPLSRAALLPDILRRLACPVLFVWGEHDLTAVPAELGPRLVGGREDRQWQLIPGAGHWVQYERAEETNALLDRWFA